MKVLRRSLFALAVGFLFPWFRFHPDPPDLRLTWNPEPGDVYHNYICPKHGDVAGITYAHVEVDKTETEETFCFRCVMDHLKDSEIARLGE
jgi:hypothetical protein